MMLQIFFIYLYFFVSPYFVGILTLPAGQTQVVLKTILENCLKINLTYGNLKAFTNIKIRRDKTKIY